MKHRFNSFCIIFLVTFILFSNTPTVAQGVLKGKNIANLKLYIVVPLEGRYFQMSGNKLVIDEHGNFNVSIPSTRPGFLYIINGLKTMILWYTPGQKSVIDLKDINAPVFSGTNAKRNQFLFEMSELSNYFSKGSENLGQEPEDIYEKLKGKFDNDISLIYAYSKANKGEEEFCRILMYERCYRFIDFFTQVALGKSPILSFQLSAKEQTEEQKQEAMAFIEKWGKTWERVYNEIYSSPLVKELNGKIEYEKPIDFLIDGEPLIYSQNFTQFLKNYYNWFLGSLQQYDRDFILSQPSDYYRMVSSRSAMMIPAVREIYIASKLEMAAYQGSSFQISDFLILYDQFKKEFPNSVYLPYLEGPAKKIEAYVAKSSKLSDEVKVYETSEIQSMQKLLSKHSRGLAYVDMWATWCGPCIEEFSHMNKLTSFIRDNKIDLIYISIDDEEREEDYRKVIAKHNLAGFNIRASQALEEDIWFRLTNQVNASREIPRYLIIKDSVIVDDNAPHPSDYEQLVAKLNSFLK
ncbi:MAG: hypothetical protein EBR30_25055 [Cytophagia bacterium]|nr:hypothetical protein [Cytophagia bacterium]